MASQERGKNDDREDSKESENEDVMVPGDATGMSVHYTKQRVMPQYPVVGMKRMA